jgi:hypothetical protein
MKQTVSTVLVNPTNEQIAEHVKIFEESSKTKLDVHRVARTNLHQSNRNLLI